MIIIGVICIAISIIGVPTIIFHELFEDILCIEL